MTDEKLLKIHAQHKSERPRYKPTYNFDLTISTFLSVKLEFGQNNNLLKI
jgi:hypothetical protein